MNTKSVAKKIVLAILWHGLRESTWRETHPLAYTDLTNYIKDMEATVVKVLDK